MTNGINFSEAKREAGRKICLRHPEKAMVVDMLEGGYELGCVSCKREGTTPVIGRRPSRIEERSKALVGSTSLATRMDRLAALKVAEVKTLLPVGKATDDEVRQFILYCRAVDADPWAREIYLVKYTERDTAAIVLALNWYLKRANRNPLYESYQSGVTVCRDGQYIDVVGAVIYPRDVLFGGWCKVYKKGARVPFERRVTMAEYDKHQFAWKTIPATMIEKVAIVQGVRRAFPDEFMGDPAGIDMPVVLEGEVAEAGNGETPPPGPMHAMDDTRQCPLDGVIMRRNKWNKWSHATNEKSNNGKIIWHNFTDEELADARAKATLGEALEDNQEPPQEDAGGPSEPSPVVSDSGATQTPVFANVGELMARVNKELRLTTNQVCDLLEIEFIGAIREKYPDLNEAWEKITAAH